MALINVHAQITSTPSTVMPSVTTTTILLNALAINTHPSANAYVDIIKRAASVNDIYLCNGLEVSGSNRMPVVLPFGKLILEVGESLVARAYGISPVSWDVVDWDTLDWNNIVYTTSMSPVDLHFSVSN